MKGIRDAINHLQQRQSSIRFTELVKICTQWFGEPHLNSGSHQVYRMPWPGDPRVNIQRGNSGMAKVYQVKQVIAALARMEEEHGKA
ncbi:toxin HicA [Serratia plymuthica]|uniref:toxin HicA n=1 Tax=Serratia plymuthica TaxID=82996 RepID=UPI001BAF075B|nr:toxin HicA [Serratia plymuthica]QUY47136.1 toxin HicA [Serratia plymuthica]